MGAAFLLPMKTGWSVPNGRISGLVLAEFILSFMAVGVTVQLTDNPKMSLSVDITRWTAFILIIIGIFVIIFIFYMHHDGHSMHNQDTTHISQSKKTDIQVKMAIIVVFGILVVVNDIFDLVLDVICQADEYKTTSDIFYNIALIFFNMFQMALMISGIRGKILLENKVLENYGICVLIVANMSVWFCSLLNEQTRFTKARDNNTTDLLVNTPDDTCTAIFEDKDSGETIVKIKYVFSQFDVLFAFFAIGTLDNIIDKDNDGSRPTYLRIEDTEDSAGTTHIERALSVISMITISIFFIILLFYVTGMLWTNEGFTETMIYVKKFSHAFVFFIFMVVAFYKLDKYYDINKAEIGTREIILLILTPFLFMYEIIRLLACFYCDFGDLHIDDARLVGEIWESAFFILADFYQTNFIIQASGATIKQGRPNMSISGACILLIILNIGTFLVDALGIYKLSSVAVLDETCYGEVYFDVAREITTTMTTVYRFISSIVLYSVYRHLNDNEQTHQKHSGDQETYM